MPIALGPFKRAVLRLLNERGYVLLKQPEYLELVKAKRAAGTEAPKAPETGTQKETSVAVAPQASTPVPGAESGAPVVSILPESAEAVREPLPDYAPAIFEAVEYIVKNNIPGDIVDCGDGLATNLSLAARALVSLGDTSRRLVLFDVTADARHRAETRLELWGSDLTDLFDEPIAKRAVETRCEEPIPDEILRTGYPRRAITIARIPAATIDFNRPVALLIAIPDTYDSNKAAVSRLIPQIPPGGVLAVYGHQGPRESLPGCIQFGTDFVYEFLQKKGVSPAFRRASESFKTAVMKTAVPGGALV